jgi:hypothetical protein
MEVSYKQDQRGSNYSSALSTPGQGMQAHIADGLARIGGGYAAERGAIRQRRRTEPSSMAAEAIEWLLWQCTPACLARSEKKYDITPSRLQA